MAYLEKTWADLSIGEISIDLQRHWRSSGEIQNPKPILDCE